MKHVYHIVSLLLLFGAMLCSPVITHADNTTEQTTQDQAMVTFQAKLLNDEEENLFIDYQKEGGKQKYQIILSKEDGFQYVTSLENGTYNITDISGTKEKYQYHPKKIVVKGKDMQYVPKLEIQKKHSLQENLIQFLKANTFNGIALMVIAIGLYLTKEKSENIASN